MTLEEARTYFSHDYYAVKQTGIVIEDVGPNYAKCSLLLDERHQNANGHVMGGVFYTLADFVFAVSTNNGGNTVTVTTDSHISYLSPCSGSVLYAESELIKDGKRNCFYRILIRDGKDTPVAVVNTTGTHLEKKTVKHE